MTEPTPTQTLRRIEGTSLWNMGVPVKVLVWGFPLVLACVSWWSQVKDIPKEMTELRRSISANDTKDLIQDEKIGQVLENQGEMKDLLKELRRDQRAMMYRTDRHSMRAGD